MALKRKIQELKKKKIRDMVKKEEQKISRASENEKLYQIIIEFKDWLNQRTYLRGDIAKIETWIKNLYSIVIYESNQKENLTNSNEKKKLIKKYKEIPPKFLDEKTRVAINKLIHGTKRTNSDNYYIRKFKNNLKEKLEESRYYKILDKLFKIL